jgi:hypothetical protein
MNYLIANRAYQSNHCPFRMSGDVDYLLTFRAFAFFAGVNLVDSNGLAATVTVEFHLGRLVGYEPYAFALGAVNLPAGELVADVDFLTT